MRHSLDLWRDNFPRSVFDLLGDVDGIFSRGWAPLTGATAEKASFRPTVDVRETEKAFLLSFDLPGVKQEDIKIDHTDTLLKVSGERKTEMDEHKDQYHRVERYYGSFERSFSFPETAEMNKIEANFENGELQIVVPKRETVEASTRAIPIQSGKSTGFFNRFLGTSKKEEPKH